MKKLAPLLAALALAALPAATADAADVAVDGQTIRYTAGLGEDNLPTLDLQNGAYVFDEPTFNGVTLTAGAGCQQVSTAKVSCAAQGATAVAIALRGGNSTNYASDTATLKAGIALPVAVTADAGSLARVVYEESARPVTVTLDGIANDGPVGRGDNFGAGIARVTSGDAGDTLSGDAAANTFFPAGGPDNVSAGAGHDLIAAARWSDVGVDAGLVTEGADTLACGTGIDTVYADSSDSADASCEHVVVVDADGYSYRGGDGADSPLFLFGELRAFGGSGNDELTGAPVDANRLYGERGDDRLAGGGLGDSLRGGKGDDLVIGEEGGDRITGEAGRDRLDGKSGNDDIRARDGERDTVRCGSGRDKVTADRKDKVISDCERVTRR